jgi:hypothetical protein
MVSVRRSTRHGRRTTRYLKKKKKIVRKYADGREDYYDRDMGGFNDWGKGYKRTRREKGQIAAEKATVSRLKKSTTHYHEKGYGLTDFVVEDDIVFHDKEAIDTEDESTWSETDESDIDAEDDEGNWD